MARTALSFSQTCHNRMLEFFSHEFLGEMRVQHSCKVQENPVTKLSRDDTWLLHRTCPLQMRGAQHPAISCVSACLTVFAKAQGDGHLFNQQEVVEFGHSKRADKPCWVATLMDQTC